MTESKNVLLESFKNRHSEKETIFSREALRLVNLYRSLSCFGSEFVDKYNQMLLSASPAVRRLLSSFMGGEEVEEYLEFLQQHAHLSDSEVEKETTAAVQTKGYLPTPDSDISKTRGDKNVSIPQKEWENIQAEHLALKQQNQQLLQALSKQKESAFNRNRVESYSEIIEDNVEDKAHE